MKEVFYEESALMQGQSKAKAKYNLFKVMSIFSYVFCALWLYFFYICFPLSSGALSFVFALLPAVIFFFSGFFIGKAKNKFYVEYDYTFISGSIRFSKVIKNVKRKFITKFECSDIEKLGKYGSQQYEKYDSMSNVESSILTSNISPADGKDFYYIVVNKNAEKYLYVLECTETFIINVIKFSNKAVIDEEYIKEISKR